MLDRSIPPPFAKEFSFSLPQPEIFQLSNGCSIIWIKGLQQQVCKIEVIMKAGKWFEPTAGLAHFTISMLEKGADGFTAKDIAGVLDLYGAQLELAAGPDFASVALYSLNNKLENVLPIFSAILKAPTFPEDELNLMKEIFVENLKVNNEKNSYIASKHFKRNIFGQGHPYGSTLELDAIESTIRPTLVRDFFEEQCQPFEVYITGSLSAQQMQQIQRAFEPFHLRPFANHSPEVREAEERIKKQVKAGSLQASVRIGCQTIRRSHADYFQLLLLNHLLGGYFGSRLMKNIREEKGLTYGIHSSISTYRNNSVFTIGTDVNVEKADLTIREIRKEIEALHQQTVPDKEIEVARNHFLGALQLELSNPFAVTEKIKNIRLNELTVDYYQQLIDSASQATGRSLQEIALRHLHWQQFHVVSVG
ncbi:MAG: M16 family metallopeptidase [Flammeovirgaceae bacterium]